MTVNLTVSDLRYTYFPLTEALRDLTFSVDAFPLVILGPNGAGKSTFLRLLTTQLLSRRGSITLDGDSTATRGGRRALRSQIGWLPQTVIPIPGLRAREQVAYSGWLKGMSRGAAWDAAEVALHRVDLQDQEKVGAGRLSGGQLRRLGIAQAIVNAPSTLLLDEPYAGLDPEQRGHVRHLIAELAEDTSVIASTHQTEDLATVYRSVVIIADGTSRFCGSVDEFLAHDHAGVDTAARAENAYRSVLRGSDLSAANP
ncbi:ATP-binding cassette domain-containing protein [Glaciihabitans arcticus]|nr:ATP-binding cassette domain-containing protein [Glaciihabitans arcticus]